MGLRDRIVLWDCVIYLINSQIELTFSLAVQVMVMHACMRTSFSDARVCTLLSLMHVCARNSSLTNPLVLVHVIFVMYSYSNIRVYNFIHFSLFPSVFRPCLFFYLHHYIKHWLYF